jgi:DNA replicative helicase MCM subunit Mcm2 (Cdc46/Mcm family)
MGKSAIPPNPSHQFPVVSLSSNKSTLHCSPAADGQKKDCPMDPYTIIHSRCAFIDHQTMKLQEAPDMVPVGELPRHMLLSVDRFVPFLVTVMFHSLTPFRYLTGRVIPGTRLIATGIYSTFSLKGVRQSDYRDYIPTYQSICVPEKQEYTGCSSFENSILTRLPP